MTWLKIDDNFAEHPKLAGLPSDAVRWFHIRAMCYAARYKTLGEITSAAFRQLGGKAAWATALVDAGLWETTSRNGWAIHDFTVYNPKREVSPEVSAVRSEAGRRGGHISASKRAIKPEANLLDENQANGEANLLLTQPREGVPSPSRPLPIPRETTIPTESSSLSAAEREILDTALSKLPTKYQRDGLAIDELEQFARDFAGKHVELANAITECRRNNELCFAGNLRKYMPGGNGNGSNGYQSRGSAQPQLARPTTAPGPGRAPDLVV